MEESISSFDSLADAYQHIKEQEILTGARYVAQRSRKPQLTDVTTLEGYYIRWEDVACKSGTGPNIPGDGTPFIILGNVSKECHQGPQRPHGLKWKQHEDHNQFVMGRRLVTPSKKQDCKAVVKIRTVLRFPSYKFEGNLSRWKRQEIASRIKREFTSSTPRELRVYVEMPNENDHSNHLTGELAGFVQNVDKSVIAKIHELVGEGVRNVAEMRRHLVTFVTKDVQPTVEYNIPPTNRRFYPTDRDIRNHINIAITQTRFSTNDQENLKKMIEKWQHDAPEDKFFFRPVTDTNSSDHEAESFLFIYQSKWQQHLLRRYGQEICLLDATYNTTAYDLPLFFLCVHTNVGYSVVAAFLLGKETKVNIKEALDILAKWNSNWNPSHFMCDFDTREIGALEASFPGCMVFLCDFHREQAWERWVKTSRHGVSGQSDAVLSLLRSIAHSNTEAEYGERLQALRESLVYKSVHLFSNWVENTWIANYKRWVSAFRTSLVNIRVSTTNGLERQHKDLKERYLKNLVSSRSLSGMLEILVNSFVPDSFSRYQRYNVQSLDTYKALASGLPYFLKNRPQKFVQHCVKRLPPYVTFSLCDIVRDEDPLKFTVTNSESGNTYRLYFCDEMPTCTCADWKKTHWPCKHMLAVFAEFPDQGWEFLSTHYTNNPVFCVDYEVLGLPEEMIENNCDTSTNTASTQVFSKEEVANTRTLRQKCLNILKSITSELYGVKDLETLQSVHENLSALESIISSKQDRKDGLPVNTAFKARKKKCCKKSHNLQLASDTAQSVGPDDILETPYEPMLDSVETGKEKNIDDETADDENGRALQLLWNSAPDDTPVLSIGPYVITSNSFHTLQNTLGDEIIDAYLMLLTKGYNTLHINCVVCTAIFERTGHRDLHNLLRHENLYMYDSCLGVINEGGIHWTLMIIEPKNKTLTYINPMGEVRRSEERVLMNWYSFLNDRHNANIDYEKPGNWSLKRVIHSKQKDGMSCGVYVLKFAENYLHERSFILGWNRKTIWNERKQIGMRLISAGNSLLSGNNVPEDNNDLPPPTANPEVQDNNDLPPPTANPEVQDNNDLPPPTANPEVQDNNDLPPPTANPEVPDNNDLPPPTADNNDLPPPTANPEVQDNNDLPPPTADNNDLPPPTANPEVQDNNGLPGRADIATSNSAKDESSYCLREKKLKRKRSSFIYPSLSKKPRLYCKCQKPYDKKRFMVFCNGCGEWYHLDCLGLQEKDVPGRRIKFFCNDCQTATVKSSTPVESTDLSNTGGLDDHRMKTYLYNIMQCSETDCHIKEHKRHHTYVKAPFATHNKEKKRAGFGLDKFDQQFIEDYTEKLVNSLTVNKLKNPSKPYTGGSYITIKDLEAESVLWKLFYDKGLLATSYIIDVLAKEALIFIYMKKQKCKYEDANADLVKSEFHF